MLQTLEVERPGMSASAQPARSVRTVLIISVGLWTHTHAISLCKLGVHLHTQCASVISAHSPARVHAALPLRFGWGVVGLGIRDGRKDLGGFVAWSVSILKAGCTM